MARRWRDYRVSIVSAKDGWDVVYARIIHANSREQAAFRARGLFPALDSQQATHASDVIVVPA